ncbi:MAG: ATP cone domain-containing protein [Candidatus Altiarchaeota archaeon]
MVQVRKHSGEFEDFDARKVSYALIRSGAKKELADGIVAEVETKAYDGITTGEIYHIAFQLLHKHDFDSAVRFSLKDAIMRLGPSGFPFEKYIAKVLEAHGFSVKLNQKLNGMCVTHEVDLIVEDSAGRYMVECKYHNQPGYYTGLKEALYTFARFEDLVDGGNNFKSAWVVSNTKCSEDALKYCKCKNVRVTSWGYPHGESLQDLIDSKCLYPITIMPHLSDDARFKLSQQGIITAGDLARMEPKVIAETTGCNEVEIKELMLTVGKLTVQKNRE